MLWLINSICLGFLSLLSHLVTEIELQNFSSVSCHCGITVTIFKTSENICQWSDNSLSKKAMPQSLYGYRSWQKNSQVAKEVKGSQNNTDSHNRNRLHSTQEDVGAKTEPGNTWSALNNTTNYLHDVGEKVFLYNFTY